MWGGKVFPSTRVTQEWQVSYCSFLLLTNVICVSHTFLMGSEKGTTSHRNQSISKHQLYSLVYILKLLKCVIQNWKVNHLCVTFVALNEAFRLVSVTENVHSVSSILFLIYNF